jgi:MFS family permease
MAKLFIDIRPLRVNKDFRLLFVGQFVSLLGSNITTVAVPYQVYEKTHSSLWVGLSSLIVLPFFIAGALSGGALGDRFDRRKLLILFTLLCVATSTFLAVNAVITHSPLGVLLVLAAVAGGTYGVVGPLRSAAIPQLVAPEDLVPAYSLMQLLMNTATVLGMSLAGLLLSVVGVSWCYGLDAISFAALTLSVVGMRPLPALGGSSAKLFRAIREGFGYVRRHAVAQAVYLVDLNAMVFGLPRALFPAVALTIYHGGPRTLGLLYAAPGAGAMVMALFTGWLNHVHRQGRLVALVVMGWGVAMAVFGLVHVAIVGLLCLAVAGCMDVISTVLRNTILQTAIVDEYRSRISSIQMAVVQGGPRLGDLESGVVATLTSVETSIVSGGIACVLGVAALLGWRPSFWRQEKVYAD